MEKIEDYAFTNLTDDTINNYNNVDYSLTSLVMGANELKLGYLSFARINVDELTTYVTLNTDKYDFPPFFMSNINSLEIKPVGDNGEMLHVEYSELRETYISTLYAYMENIQKLKLAEGITFVPGNMFAGSNIKNIELPSTFKNISPYSLTGLNADELIIPEGVNSVGNYAFYRSKFNTISFPSTLKTIGRSAFEECTNLTEITLNEIDISTLENEILEKYPNTFILGNYDIKLTSNGEQYIAKDYSETLEVEIPIFDGSQKYYILEVKENEIKCWSNIWR